MLPFVTVGILVVCAFCAISCIMDTQKSLRTEKSNARTTIRGMEADIYYLQGKLSEEEIRQKYKFYHDPAVRIMAADGDGQSQGTRRSRTEHGTSVRGQWKFPGVASGILDG